MPVSDEESGTSYTVPAIAKAGVAEAVFMEGDVRRHPLEWLAHAAVVS